jgi:hypothetical protein
MDRSIRVVIFVLALTLALGIPFYFGLKCPVPLAKVSDSERVSSPKEPAQYDKAATVEDEDASQKPKASKSLKLMGGPTEKRISTPIESIPPETLTGSAGAKTYADVPTKE